MTDREIIWRFFAEHPEHADGVRRATFAYHKNHRDPGGHYFLTSARDSACRWCGLTREMVRWGDDAPTCARRPKWADETIESVIAREEKLFDAVLARAKKLAREIDVNSLTGAELATLHHTHGVDPSMLECALMEEGRSLPQRLHDDYQRAYAAHRDTGRRGLKRVIVVAKSAGPVA